MKKIVCIGAGKLANHLMPVLQSAGCEIIQIYNRSDEHAKHLSQKLESIAYTTNVEAIRRDGDLYFFTLSDDVVPFVADQLQHIVPENAIAVHCSGSLNLDALPFANKAAFYPVQSFSPHYDVSWKYIPIIITTKDDNTWNILDEIASNISTAIYRMTDDQKSVLHLAAVFANNFSNHMLVLAESICKVNQLPFEILKPLIIETFSKAILSGANESQTGPAARGDGRTIKKHRELLTAHPKLLEVYDVITLSIKSK